MIITKKIFAVSGIYLIKYQDKEYIGSSKYIYQRLMKHRYNLRRNKHENIILQNIYNKYKEDNIECILLEICDEKLLKQREQYYIDLRNPYINITKKVERNILSKSSRNKISNTLKEKYKKGIIKPTNISNIVQYTKDGEFVKEYDTIKQASEENNIHVTTIIRCLNKTYKTGKNYQWFYKNKIELLQNFERKKIKPYLQIKIENVNTNEIHTFIGWKDVCDFLNINHYATLTYFIKNNKVYKQTFKISTCPSKIT